MNYYKKHFDLRIKVQFESTSSSQVIRWFKNHSSIKSTSLLPVKRWFNVIPGVVLVFSSIWKVNEKTPYQAFLSGKGKSFPRYSVRTRVSGDEDLYIYLQRERDLY